MTYFCPAVMDENYPEVMITDERNKLYIQWNLENTAKILAQRFPDSLIVVVKPREMLLNKLSVYSNFVYFDETGIPTLFTNKGALTHLMKLYTNARKIFFSQHFINGSQVCTDSSHVTSYGAETIAIVGFSKGCVPLNQIMFEIATTELLPETVAFVSKITSVYWLDSGHRGKRDTWITNEFVLQRIAETKIQLFVHVSPHQVKNPKRPWIRKEEEEFVQKLKALNANLKETKHHFDEPCSLDNHFLILTEF